MIESFHLPSYFVGLVAGGGIVLFATSWMSNSYPDLDNCAKTHNVYQCEMVAVPKTGEK